jgi:vitamin B12 transporter
VHPLVYLVRQVPYTTTVADPGTTLVKESETLFPFPSSTFTDRASGAYQGTLAHRGGSLSFGYEYERQAGIISGLNVNRHDNGFFVTEQYAVTPRIFLNAAARLEQSSAFGTKFAPRAAATFLIAKETYFRVSAARGIQEPSLLENFAHESFYVGNPALRPEKTTSYEAGISRQWFARRLETGASAFRNSFRDLIVFDFTNFPGTFSNIDRSWARGVEIYATARPVRYVTVRAAYTRLYTRITNTSSASQIGTELLRRPRNSGSVTLEVTPRRWSLIAGARLVGESADGDFVFGVNRNPGYEYVYADGSWQATRHVAPFVRVANALDETYQEALGYTALSRSATGGIRVSW